MPDAACQLVGNEGFQPSTYRSQSERSKQTELIPDNLYSLGFTRNPNRMKQCFKCKITKSFSEFSIRNTAKDTYQSWCKPCFSERDKQRWSNSSDTRRQTHYSKRKLRMKRNRTTTWNYLMEHPCAHCGETDPRVLEFDHTDPNTKQDCVSNLYHLAPEKIMEEISKCQVLCANCHRRKTYTQMGYYIPTTYNQ